MDAPEETSVRSRKRLHVLVTFLIVLSLLGFAAGRVAASSEMTSADWNWWDPSGTYSACGKTSVHFNHPYWGPDVDTGRGYSWLTGADNNCDASKVSAYSRVDTLLYGRESGVWYVCMNAGSAGWSTASYVVAHVGKGCGITANAWMTISTFGTCVSGVCRESGASQGGTDVCHDEDPTPGAGEVDDSCETLELYPLASPVHE